MSFAAFLLPLLAIVVLVVTFGVRLWAAGLVAFLLASALWLGVPEVGIARFPAPLVRALIVSCEVALILLGAISFLEVMQRSGFSERIKNGLQRTTGDEPISLALILAWFFCAFLEGAAGFGAPAAVIAPLLLSLGYPVMLAAVLPLVGNSTSVPFGAVGTPVRLGFESLPIESVPPLAAALNLVVGLVPVLFLRRFVLGRLDGSGASPQSSDTGRSVVIAAGFCFTIPAFALSFLGPEFPSLLGSVAGLILFVAVLAWQKRRIRPAATPAASRLPTEVIALGKNFSPYLLLGIALLAGKLVVGGRKFNFEIQGSVLGVSYFQPGLVFLLVILCLRFGAPSVRAQSLAPALASALRRLPPVFLAVFFMASLAQFTMTFFDPSRVSLDGAKWNATLQWGLVVFAPFVGVGGAFLSGSATVSNLLFGGILHPLSQLSGVSSTLVLSLQLVGAGVGNMIALQNLAAVQTTVGLRDAEGTLLGLLWKPCFVSAGICSLVGVFTHAVMLFI